MGGKDSLNVLGQAYLQYQNPWLRMRVGDQLINTPWMNTSDIVMISSTFHAVTAQVTPYAGQYEGHPGFWREGPLAVFKFCGLVLSVLCWLSRNLHW